MNIYPSTSFGSAVTIVSEPSALLKCNQRPSLAAMPNSAMTSPSLSPTAIEKPFPERIAIWRRFKIFNFVYLWVTGDEDVVLVFPHVESINEPTVNLDSVSKPAIVELIPRSVDMAHDEVQIAQIA